MVEEIRAICDFGNTKTRPFRHQDMKNSRGQLKKCWEESFIVAAVDKKGILEKAEVIK